MKTCTFDQAWAELKIGNSVIVRDEETFVNFSDYLRTAHWNEWFRGSPVPQFKTGKCYKIFPFSMYLHCFGLAWDELPIMEGCASIDRYPTVVMQNTPNAAIFNY